MVKKHQFHCVHCNSTVQIYKKGKGHRVMVCPLHGIIATNPGMLGSAIEFGSSFIPVPGAAMIGKAVGGMVGKGKGESASIQREQRNIQPVKVRELALVDLPDGVRVI